MSLTQGTPPRYLIVKGQRGQDRQNDLGSNLASCLSTAQCLVECNACLPRKKAFILVTLQAC